MSLAAPMFQIPNSSTSTSGVPRIGVVRRAQVARDFVLLVTICLSIGLAVGLAVMVTVFALL
jgi:hypothetical protein